MEKRYGHMASLATSSRVYNLCAEVEQVVQRSASSSDRQTQLYNGQCGQNGEMCTALVRVHPTRWRERLRRIDLSIYIKCSVDCAAIITM